jgi:hypothetical protein
MSTPFVWVCVVAELLATGGVCVVFLWATLLQPEQFNRNEQTIWAASIALIVALDVFLLLAHTTLVLLQLSSEDGDEELNQNSLTVATVGYNRLFFFSRICVWFAVLFTLVLIICGFSTTVGNSFQAVCLIPASFLPVLVATAAIAFCAGWRASRCSLTRGCAR